MDETDDKRRDGSSRTNRAGVKTVSGIFGVAFALLAVAVSAVVLPGCDTESCNQIRRDYQQAVDSETGLVELEETGPPHAAVAVDLETLDEWTSTLIDTAVGQALSLDGTLRVQGQSIDYSVGSTEANLQFEASDACDACLRVFGDIDGQAEVEVPAIGTQAAPLSGSMDWTVPLDVGRRDGEAAVFFDTEEAVQMGIPELEASLEGLPGDWSQPLVAALVEELGQTVADSVEPIQMFGYGMPDLGVEGLEIAPSLLSLDAASDSLILGVRSNLNVPSTSRSDDEIVEALKLDGSRQVAVAADPRLALESARLALRERHVPRRYTLSGEADDDGVAYAVVDDLSAGRPDEGEGLGVGLDFRVFNFRSSLACFSMTGETRSRLAIEEGALELEIQDVQFSGPTALIEAANWGSAEFVEHSGTILEQSLDGDAVSSPEIEARILPTALSTEAGMIVIGGTDAS